MTEEADPRKRMHNRAVDDNDASYFGSLRIGRTDRLGRSISPRPAAAIEDRRRPERMGNNLAATAASDSVSDRAVATRPARRDAPAAAAEAHSPGAEAHERSYYAEGSVWPA
jgi:hypothetical protein